MRRLLPALALSAALSCGFASSANAQSGAEADIEKAGAPLDQVGVIRAPQLQLVAGTEDDSASIAFQLPTGPSQANSFGIILSTPLNGEDEAAPATLDGLANGTTLTVRWGHFSLSPPGPVQSRRAAELVAKARGICVRRAGADAEAIAGCDRENSNNLVGLYLNDRENREYSAQTIRHDASNFGFEVAVGINRFEFVDPATLAESSERHTQWRARIFYDQYLRRPMTAFTLSAGYERAYEAADEEIFCPPNTTNAAVRCVQARGAPPELNESLLISAGFRHRFIGAESLRNFAIAPLVTYDVLDDVVGVDVPIYFLPDGDGGLTGGVRFGYRSDRENEFSVGIFIGAAFNILGGD